METYTNSDVSGLARVFTGLSWGGPDTTDNRYSGRTVDPNREIIPREWFGFYEVGLRYRIPQRSWGIAGSYREGVAFHQPQSLRYPRYRTFNIGVFTSFR